MNHAKITSTGFYVPERLVPNSYFNDLYKQDVDTFLRQKRNITQRYFMSPEQSTSDLIVPAATQALNKAGIGPEELDLIIVATDTPDFMSPSTAAVVQHKIKAINAGAFDINAACAGFVTALDVGSNFIRARQYNQNILVIGAYAMSKFLDFDDYKIATLFADGAGAVVLQSTPNQEEGILSSYFWADGSYKDAMGIYAGGSAYPISPEAMEKHDHLLKFHRRIPPEFNSTHWPRVIQRILEPLGYLPKDVKHYLLTQINIDSIHQTLDVLEQPHSKSHNIMDRFGYTGSACLPMALADADEQGLLKKGDLIAMVGSGGGISMGGVALRW